MGIWERDEGIRTAVEAGLGELAAEVRAGRHPAELAGARLELLTVSPAARGWAGAGAVPCGTVLLPGTAGPLARALNARQAVSYGTSPRDTLTFSSLEGDRLCLAVQRELVTLGGAVVEQQELVLPFSTGAFPPALSGRRGHSAAPGCAAGGAAGAVPPPGVRPAKRPRNRAVPGPSSSRKDFSAGC